MFIKYMSLLLLSLYIAEQACLCDKRRWNKQNVTVQETIKTSHIGTRVRCLLNNNNNNNDNNNSNTNIDDNDDDDDNNKLF